MNRPNLSGIRSKLNLIASKRAVPATFRADLRKLTLTASLAAVYTIFRVIPISRLIGISGSITAAGMVVPIIGVLLEPSYGIATVFVGTLIASLFPWNPLKFYGLDFLPGALNVALVSLAVRGRRTEAILMFLAVIGLFLINPFTTLFVGARYLSPPIPYLWLHLIALLVLISPVSRNLAQRLSSGNYSRLLTGVVVVAFTGTMIEHLTGGILFAAVVGRGALAFWPVIFLAYPIERAILVLGAVLICTPVIGIIKGTVRERTKPRFALKASENLDSGSGGASD